jgi:aryl-alcohol dehydrogenase-like predicted oxidoreductase
VVGIKIADGHRPLRRAFDAGVTFFDSDTYDSGNAETILQRRWAQREQIVIGKVWLRHLQPS